jgi:hypothetical protein
MARKRFVSIIIPALISAAGAQSLSEMRMTPSEIQRFPLDNKQV